MKKSIIFLSVIIFLSSCSIYRPDSQSITKLDYNKRVNIEGAHFDKTLTSIGISSFVVVTAGGGYLGYLATQNSDYFAEYKNTDKRNYSIAGGVLGAFVGFTSAYLLNKAFGWGKTKRPYSPEQWIKKANKHYVLINETSNTDFEIMHKSSESDYKVKNIKDARDFVTAYTADSRYANSTAQQTLDNPGISRENYIELMQLFPSNPYMLNMKKHYVRLSPTVSSLFGAYDRFPETELDIERKATNLVTNFYDAKIFNNRFPRSIYNKKVIIKALNQSTENEIARMSSMFKQDFDLNQSDFSKYYTTDQGKRKFINAHFILSPPADVYDIEPIYKKYKWLNYSNRNKDILNKYWDVGYRTISNGNKLLAYLHFIAQDRSFDYYGISRSMVSDYVKDKLKNEIRRNVNYKVKGNLGNNNKEWELWLKNTEYTAGIVKDQSQFDFLVYGTVTNNSKFDLPLKVNVAASMYTKHSLKGTGSWTNGALKLLELATKQNLHSGVSKAGSADADYYYRNIKRGETLNYAVVLDYGGTKRFGLNVGDLYKYTEEIFINDIYVNLSYGTTHISKQILNRQNSWQYFAKNGLPDTPLHDVWRNEKVENAAWEAEWEAIKEERRRRERERKQAARDMKENSTFTWAWKGNWTGGEKGIWSDYPFERKFIIKKDGEDWAEGHLEKGKKSNYFDVEFEVNDHDYNIYRSIDEHFHYDPDSECLTLDPGGLFSKNKSFYKVKTFSASVNRAISELVNIILDRIIKY